MYKIHQKKSDVSKSKYGDVNQANLNFENFEYSEGKRNIKCWKRGVEQKTL